MKTNNTVCMIRIVPKFNEQNVQTEKIVTLSTHIHDRSISCLGTDTSMKSGGAKLVLWTQISPLSEIM